MGLWGYRSGIHYIRVVSETLDYGYAALGVVSCDRVGQDGAENNPLIIGLGRAGYNG